MARGGLTTQGEEEGEGGPFVTSQSDDAQS